MKNLFNNLFWIIFYLPLTVVVLLIGLVMYLTGNGEKFMNWYEEPWHEV